MTQQDKPFRDEKQQQLLANMLENQKVELALKAKELDIRNNEIESSRSYSMAVLAAQKDNLKETRDTYVSSQKIKWLAMLVALFLVLSFFGLAIILDKEKLVSDIMTVAIPSILSAVGGYWFGRSKSKP